MLDLFRYASAGTLATTTSQDAYFSTNGGQTLGAAFCSGGTDCSYGAGHWQSTGLMQPVLAPNTVQGITPTDITAMVALGWEAEPTSAPEPATISLFATALAGLVAVRRRQRRTALFDRVIQTSG